MDRDSLTRPDPFAEVWPQMQEQLQLHPGLEAKTFFADLQRRFPGRFADEPVFWQNEQREPKAHPMVLAMPG